ncbi:MAG: protein-arginine deiminase domain-containing protein [Rhodospirillales bacterium]|nr:protein-arginine deiminase domain-containing protein [Rhodospirillales bacterium]
MTSLTCKPGYPDQPEETTLPCQKTRVVITAYTCGFGVIVPNARVTLHLLEPNKAEMTGTADEYGVITFFVKDPPSESTFSVTGIAPGIDIAYENKSFNVPIKANERLCTIIQCGNELRMYLDADRDGEVDAEPVNYNKWEWGEGKKGGILYPFVKENDTKIALSPLQLVFRWKGNKKPEKAQNLIAKLTISPPGRVLFFNDKETKQEVKVGNLLDLSASDLYDEKGTLTYFLVAKDFPNESSEDAALVNLHFECFLPTWNEAFVQNAVLRIAPWIMASDLEPVQKIYVGATDKRNYVQTKIQSQFGSLVKIQLLSGIKKPFARDSMKIGHVGNSLVLLDELDPGSYYSSLGKEIAKIVIRPPASDANGQDGGGNYLVTPPLKNFPFGRIVYGDKDDKLCRAGAFLRAQRVQQPIVVDTTWLSVGHVDEIMSFAPGQQGECKLMLASPRVALALLWSAASEGALPPKKALEMAQGWPDLTKLQQSLNEIYPIDFNSAVEKTIPHFQVTGIDDDKFDVSGQNGAMVLWATDNGLQAAVKGLYGNLEDKDFVKIKYFQEKNPVLSRNLNKNFIKISIPAKLFLEINGKTWLPVMSETQKILDTIRQTLMDSLCLQDTDITEIPAMFRKQRGQFLSPDSVNMLVINTGNQLHCVVPKPFGPVLNNTYIFEEYIADCLDRLGLKAIFLADFEFSQSEGEIHCGSNQVPQPRKRPWWMEQFD